MKRKVLSLALQNSMNVINTPNFYLGELMCLNVTKRGNLFKIYPTLLYSPYYTQI